MLNDELRGWIGGFARRSRAVVYVGRLPDEVLRSLGEAPHVVEIRPDRPAPPHCADFALSLAAEFPADDSLVDHFGRLLSPLVAGGICLLTAPAADACTCERVARLLAHTGNLRVVREFSTDQPERHGWLMQKTAPAVMLPAPGQWNFSPGDEMVRALNGNGDALAHVGRSFVDSHALAAAFRSVFAHVRSHLDFECTGWSLIECGTHQACFLAGLVRGNGTKRVSAAGTSWAEAALLLLCEAIERSAQLTAPDTITPSGTAFGLSREGAVFRAVLESLERFHFHRIFRGMVTPVTLDIRDDEFLAGLVGSLEAAGRRVKLFVLTDDEPFHVVLAIHSITLDGRTGRLACGLGCTFDPTTSARKAVLEALKGDIYIDCDNIGTDTRMGAMPHDARETIAFWSAVAHWTHLDFLDGGPTRRLGPCGPVPDTDDEALSRVSAWCARSGITIQSHPLLVKDGAWVYGANCSGLTPPPPPGKGDIPSPLF